MGLKVFWFRLNLYRSKIHWFIPLCFVSLLIETQITVILNCFVDIFLSLSAVKVYLIGLISLKADAKSKGLVFFLQNNFFFFSQT